MYSQARSPTHTRSFSFTNWDSRQGNRGDQRLYYNYSKNDRLKNQYRGDIPSFGESANQKNQKARNRFSQEQYSFDFDRKIKPDYLTRGNGSLDRHQRDKLQKYSSKPAWQQYSYQQNISRDKMNQDNSMRNACRYEFQKVTQEKLSNIDKINEKIRKILNTLSEEEKKISQHHQKIGSRRVYKNGYANRIKTEGDDLYLQNNLLYGGSALKTQFKQYNDYPDNSEQLTNDFNSAQKFRKNFGNKRYQTQQFQQSQIRVISTASNWNRPLRQVNEDRILQEVKNQTNNNVKVKKNQPEVAYKLLKGTNVKSTDSLNLSMSICYKNDKEKQNEKFYKQNQKDLHKYNGPQESQKAINLKYHYNQNKERRDYNNQSYDRNQVYRKKQNQNNYVGAKNQRIKTEPCLDERNNSLSKKGFLSNQLNLEPQKIQSPTFYQIEANKRLQRTPTKSRFEKSLTKYEKSEKSCKLSNGKDLDQQIEKIQKKIQDCEQIKKSLNLQEDQACKKSRTELNRSLSKYKDRYSQSKSKYDRSELQFTEKNIKIGQKQNHVAEFSAETQIKEIRNEKKYKSNVNKNQNAQVQVSLPKPFKMCSKKNTKRTQLSSQIKEIESAFISEERREYSKDSIRTLIQLLCRQIDLDTSFRNSKKWLSRKTNSSKWSQLNRQLQMKKIPTNEQQNRKIFTLTQEQDNPFYTERDQEGSYEELIRNFISSQKHWIDNIQQKFSRQEIENYIQEMDIYRRGTITIQDLVRYINLESDKYYRNRDLSLIYRRLSGSNQSTTVELVLQQFCHT